MLRYIFDAGNDLSKQDMVRIIKQLETNEMKGEELAMTLAEMWKEIGVQQGLQQGKNEALLEVTLLQLTHKFGALPKNFKEVLAQADAPALQLILTNMFTFEHIDEVKRYLHVE
ncbi:hypothetical protein [Lysinibacillus piscis]|uniref:DUF4351 domain-containing protein n=1 Tax=Lysinibacillus piscis TaxID=2518931 RepID=A0ABQ5NLN9_9BACI|nr:hypothetical protein [Lysinibacillus sp. KH24]GLC89222.1 hypothetical protein LYSBPC_23490 [Lysinibacillus sp. KH24]